MNEKKLLVRHASLTSIANLAHALTQWLLLVIIVKQFNDNILGQLVLSLSIISPTFLLLSFKLRTLVVTDYHNLYPFEQYLHARIFAHMAIIFLLIILIPMVLPSVSPTILLSVIIFKVCDGISELCYSYLHKQQAFSKAAISQTSRSFTTIIALCSAGYFSNNEAITFSVWAMTTLAFTLIDLKLVAQQVNQDENRHFSLLKTILSFSSSRHSLALFKQYWPIGLSITLGAMFVYIPNYALEYFRGTQTVGQFAAISYFLVAGSVFINSLSQAATPKLSNAFNNHKFKDFIKITKLLMLIGAAIGLIGLLVSSLIGTWLLTFFYNESIALLSIELQLIFLASLIRYSYIFLGTALNVLRCFNQQVIVYGSGSCVLAIGCFLLIPQYGTIGAATSMVIACLVEFIVMVLIFTRSWQKVDTKLGVI